MEPIKITPVSEKEYSRTPQRTGGYEVIVERIGVDQYGREWHSFHRQYESDREETPPGDKPASGDEPLTGELWPSSCLCDGLRVIGDRVIKPLYLK